MLKEQIDKEVKQYYIKLMEFDVRAMRVAACEDLHYGPGEVEYPDGCSGYLSAIKKLEDWADEHLCETWVDADSMEILTQEPDPMPEYIYYYSKKAVAHLLFKDLIAHGSMSA